MKWLIDAQLPPRLCGWLKKRGETCFHTVDISGGLNLSDELLWKHAKNNDFIIVSKDNDFFEYSLLYSSPPQVLFVQLGNSSNDYLISKLEKYFDEIKVAFEQNRALVILTHNRLQIF